MIKIRRGNELAILIIISHSNYEETGENYLNMSHLIFEQSSVIAICNSFFV